MKKLKLFIAALALLGGGNLANAQTDVFKDVTSDYLTNADFEGTYSIKSGTGVSNDRAIYQPEGWTVTCSGFTTNECSVLKEGDKLWTNFFSSLSSAPDGGNQTYWIRLHKDGNGQRLTLSQGPTLKKGTYDFSAYAYFNNTSYGSAYIQVGSSSSSRSSVTSNASWVELKYTFESDGSNSTTLYCGAWHQNKKDHVIVGFDNVKLKWNLTKSLNDLIDEANTFIGGEDDDYADLQSVVDAAEAVKESTDATTLENNYDALTAALDLAKNHRKPWLDTWTTANTNNDSNDYANVIGEEKTALEAELAKAEPTTAEGYDEAKNGLETANSTFTAAKASYDAFVAAKNDATPDLAYATAAKKKAVNDAKNVTATTATDATTKTADIVTALRAYYESHALAEGVSTAMDLTSRITNAEDPTDITGWTITNTTGNINLGTKDNEPYTDADGTNTHSYFDSDSWSSAFTTNITQDLTLPTGTYLLTVKARGNDVTMFNVIADSESTAITPIGNTGGVFDKGWNDYSVEFTLSENKSVTFGIEVKSGSSSKWISFGDFRLVKLDVTYADQDDYDALNSAISTAEANTLGFESGEYAPYNNIDAIAKLAVAKAINQNVDNIQSEVQDATTALSDETWTANTAEVNAIYDGTLANAPIQATSENVVLPGWDAKEGSLRQTFSGTGEGGKACLSGADDGVGLFVHPGTYVYGETTGYTMPLKANVTYLARAKYCAWADGSNNNFTLTIKKGNTTVVTKSYGANKTACTVEGALKEVILYFTPTEDGDYTLSIVTDGNTFMTDIYIMKAVEVEISETDSSAPEENKYAIVTLNRTLSSGYWNTFSVPFDMDIPTGWEVKEFDSATDNVINFKTAESIVAGNPYLVKPESDVVNPTYTGVDVVSTEGEIMGTGNYKFAAQIYNKTLDLTNGTVAYLATDGSIKKLTSATGLKGLRAYFIIPAGGNARIAFTDGDQTGIKDTVRETTNDNRVYDLQGRQVKAVKKGIYVVNGKKIIK